MHSFLLQEFKEPLHFSLLIFLRPRVYVSKNNSKKRYKYIFLYRIQSVYFKYIQNYQLFSEGFYNQYGFPRH